MCTPDGKDRLPHDLGVCAGSRHADKRVASPGTSAISREPWFGGRRRDVFDERAGVGELPEIDFGAWIVKVSE
jgi:hypothetical protein